ncbi:unnamed protein product [Discula destructiva]
MGDAGFPDYMLDPDAVTKDKVEWRHGGPPDYTGTRKMWAEEKHMNHDASSLESLVENLVKNWEIEASHKTNISQWRTVDPENYSFAINGGPPQDAKHMLKVGTYSAIIASNKYYGPQHTNLEDSHNTFRNMMPNFAWEVLEVYSGPPTVAFKWRHWGWMKGDYVGKNEDGTVVTIKSHNDKLDIRGVTVAKVNEKFQVTQLETWFDPMEMFNQMKPSREVLASQAMECPLGFKADLEAMEKQEVEERL